MLDFLNFIVEDMERKDPTSTILHAFDLDETLFHHDHSKVKVHVNDEHGKRVESLTNQEFNTHKLKPKHSYNFDDFRSTHIFKQSAHPIHKMIKKLKAIHKNNKNVEIVTARSDLDDKKGFMDALGKHGINTREVHVRRAGNTPGTPGEAKRKVISNLIKKHGYKKVHLYDDSEMNLQHFASLKQDHPDVELHAHHVHYNPETNHVNIKTTKYK